MNYSETANKLIKLQDPVLQQQKLLDEIVDWALSAFTRMVEQLSNGIPLSREVFREGDKKNLRYEQMLYVCNCLMKKFNGKIAVELGTKPVEKEVDDVTIFVMIDDSLPHYLIFKPIHKNKVQDIKQHFKMIIIEIGDGFLTK